MESLPAHLGLALKAGEVKLVKIKVGFVRTEDQEAFYDLSQQILMMEGDECTPVFQRKDDPRSQISKNLIRG